MDGSDSKGINLQSSYLHSNICLGLVSKVSKVCTAWFRASNCRPSDHNNGMKIILKSHLNSYNGTTVKSQVLTHLI